MILAITRLEQATAIHPPGHVNVQPFQLHGGDHSHTDDLAVVISHYLPGATAQADTMRTETVYFVLVGELLIMSDGQEAVLRQYDSVRLAAGVTRVLENRGPLPTTILVVRSIHTA